jgi:hypothetical protein
LGQSHCRVRRERRSAKPWPRHGAWQARIRHLVCDHLPVTVARGLGPTDRGIQRRENLIEHVFLGELLRGLWRKNVRDLEVLRPEVDSGGSDLALEFKGVIRHVQLKSSFTGARRSDVTAHVKLFDRPSACILWIFFDPDNAYLSLEFRV